MKTIPKPLATQILNANRVQIKTIDGETKSFGAGEILDHVLYLKEVLATHLNDAVLDSEYFNYFFKGFNASDEPLPSSITLDEKGNIRSAPKDAEDSSSIVHTFVKNTSKHIITEKLSDSSLIEEYNKLAGKTEPQKIIQILGKEQIKYLIGELKVITIDDFKKGQMASSLELKGANLEDLGSKLNHTKIQYIPVEDEIECVDLGELPVLSSDQLKRYNDISKKMNLSVFAPSSTDLKPEAEQSSENSLAKILNLAKTIELEPREASKKTIQSEQDIGEYI